MEDSSFLSYNYDIELTGHGRAGKLVIHVHSGWML